MVTRNKLAAAVVQLSRSERGREAMQHLNDLLMFGGSGLDTENQEAVLSILRAAWTDWTVTACLLMNEALDREPNTSDPHALMREVIEAHFLAGDTR